LLAVATNVHARDLGFRFVDGKCAGYNPSYLGQCADLRSVTLSGFSLDDLDLSGAAFDHSDLQNTSFKGSNLTGASFAGAAMGGVDFDGAILHRTSFAGASLVNTHLAGADLLEVDFTAADLTNALLNNMNFPGCIFSAAQLAGAQMDHSDLSQADLRGTDLTGLDLRGSLFHQSQLESTNFFGADLRGAHFEQAHASHVNFSHAVLTDVHFDQAQLTGASFRNSDLSAAVFSSADLTQADFRRTVMKTASFNQAVLTGAKYSTTTALPFSLEEAGARGMVLAKSGVLILWDSKGPDLSALTAYLEAHGVDTNLSALNATAYDGRESLSDYSAVLHLLGAASINSHNVPADGQDALKNFVYSGGTYAATQMIGRMADINFLLKRMADLILLGYQTFNSDGGTWLAEKAKAAHPLLTGIPDSVTIKGMTVSSPLHSLIGNTVLMRDNSGLPVLAARAFGAGRIVNFGFAGAIEGDGNANHILTQEPVQKLILNAVTWLH
jgi:uncharacterized protein YjbI with pentapeptide repeats